MKQAKEILLKHLAGEEIGGDNFDNVILAMNEYAALRLGEYVIREVMEKFKADLNASKSKIVLMDFFKWYSKHYFCESVSAKIMEYYIDEHIKNKL